MQLFFFPTFLLNVFKQSCPKRAFLVADTEYCIMFVANLNFRSLDVRVLKQKDHQGL